MKAVLTQNGWKMIGDQPASDELPCGPLLGTEAHLGPWDVTSGPPLRPWEVDERRQALARINAAAAASKEG